MKKGRSWLKLSILASTLLLMTMIVGQVHARRYAWASIDGRSVSVETACKERMVLWVVNFDYGPPAYADDVFTLSTQEFNDWSYDREELGTPYPAFSDDITVALVDRSTNSFVDVITVESPEFQYEPTMIFISETWWAVDKVAQVEIAWPNPDLVKEGLEIHISTFGEIDPTGPVPGEGSANAVVEAACSDFPTEYVVQPGDTLRKIAEKFYGKSAPACYMPIFDANRDQLWNPNIIYAGMTLTIPPKPLGC